MKKRKTWKLRLTAWILSLAMGISVLPLTAMAEGTRSVLENGGYRPCMEFFIPNSALTNVPRAGSLTTAGIKRQQIIYVYVHAGETLYFGSSVAESLLDINHTAQTAATGCDIVVESPNGNIEAYDVQNTGENIGYIATGEMEQIGPNVSEETVNGYNPLSFTAQENGTYTFYFHSEQGGAVAPDTQTNFTVNAGPSTVSAWDVSVYRDGVKHSGRAYTKYLAWNMGSNVKNADVLNSTVYVVTTDGYIYKTDFNGMDPYGFIFFANNRGLVDADKNMPLYHSIINRDNTMSQQNLRSPELPDTVTDQTYKIFFEEPDAELIGIDGFIQSAQAPKGVTNFRFWGNYGDNATGFQKGGEFFFDIERGTSATVTMDLSNVQLTTENEDGTAKTEIKNYGIVRLSNPVYPGTNSFKWDGKVGDGANEADVAELTDGYLPSGIYNKDSINISIEVHSGESHFPLIDVENNRNGIKIERINPIYDNDMDVTVEYEDSSYTTYYNNEKNNKTEVGKDRYPVGDNLDCSVTGTDSSVGAMKFESSAGDYCALDIWAYTSNDSSENLIFANDFIISEANIGDSENIAQGICGQNLVWVLDQAGTLTIAGSGAMLNYPSESSVSWYPYRDSIQNVVLEDGVTSISSWSFTNYTAIKTIDIPDSVTSIGEQAFRDCRSLTSITIPEGVTSIGECAFRDCQSLTSITIPESVTSIGEGAFWGCQSLTSITIPESVTSIGEWAFWECWSLTSITIPEGVTSIGEYAFSGCQSLTSVTIPESVTSIGECAFSGCRSLTSVTIPEGVTSIGECAFCECWSLTSVTIPESVTSIGECAFSGCRSLTSVKLPNRVTTMPTTAFEYCKQLVEIDVDADHPAYASVDGLLYNKGKTEILLCPEGKAGRVVIPDTVQSVEKTAFLNCDKLSEIVLPDGIVSINERAFYCCSSLESISLPDSVQSIGTYAFHNCDGLKRVILPKGMIKLEPYTFSSCDNLTSVIIPDSLKTIGAGAFSYCSALTSVDIGSGVTNITYTAFRSCNKLSTMYFRSAKVPILSSSISSTTSSSSYMKDFFEEMPVLKTVLVPTNSLSAYQNAWKSYLPSGTQIVANLDESAVSNLYAATVCSHSVSLHWSPHPSARIIGYHIYRNDKQIADITENRLNDTNLENNTDYTYVIKGYRADGKETDAASVSVTTAEPQILEIRTSNQPNRVILDNGTLYAYVKDNGNLKNGTFYYIDDSDNKIELASDVEYAKCSPEEALYRTDWDISGMTASKYDVGFSVTDADGETGETTVSVIVDTYKPEAVTSVSAIGDTDQIVLSWTKSHETITNQYRIYRRAEEEKEFSLLTVADGRDTLSYTDTAVEKDHSYEYYIIGVNTYGQTGEPSEIAAAEAHGDLENPQVVSLSPANSKRICGTVAVSAKAEDNVAVEKTQLYLSLDTGDSWTLLKTQSGSTCEYSFDTKQYDDGIIFVKGMASDAAGNTSTGLVYTYCIDNTGPEQVTGLSYESTATTVTLRWNDVAAQDFSYFRVEQQLANGNFQTVQDHITKIKGANILNLEANQEYKYRVVAYDQLGNRGEASEIITAVTTADVDIPVITALSPYANYFNNLIPVKITAQDNTGISAITVQISEDGIHWDDYQKLSYGGTTKTVTASAQLQLDTFAEGYLYVRGLAEDRAGNVSDASSKAPSVQYIVDHTAPEMPQNFSANSSTGAIELSWTMGTEDDLNTYTIYRSLDGIEYSRLAYNLKSINYWDRTVDKDTNYWYKLCVTDYAGNISEQTKAIQAILPTDTIAPVINSFAPSDNSIIGPSNATFYARISDNWRLDTASVTYTINDSTDVNTLLDKRAINNYYKDISIGMPISNLSDGDVLHLSISITDAEGLGASKKNITYTVDKTAPQLQSVQAQGSDGKITITWAGNNEADLAGYRIYRKTATGSYSMIAQRAASTSAYSYTDNNVSGESAYYYKVEAVDTCGNSSAMESDKVWAEIIPVAKAEFTCDAMQEINVEYSFDASLSMADSGIETYTFDFGDGTVQQGENASVIHKYTTVGSYTVKLTVTDAEGRIAESTRQIDVQQPQMLGSVKISTVDASGKAISGIPIYFDLDNSSQNIKTSNIKGYAEFSATAQQYTVGAYAAEYLPVKKSIVVRANEVTEIKLTMVAKPIVTGNFEVTRMTLDEIKAAGIDTAAAANKQIVNVLVHLTYDSKPLTMNVVTDGEKTYSGGTQIIDTNEGKRRISTNVVCLPNSNTSSNNVVVAVMDIPVQATYLKEFFDVRLHIMNNADESFELTNNMVQLQVPEGMSLVDTNITNTNASVSFPSLKGQQEKELCWTLRGDVAGNYDLEADYSAILDTFKTEVNAKFKTNEPITVYGKDAIKITVNASDKVSDGDLYFNIGMENVGGADIYLPTLDIFNHVVQVFEDGDTEGVNNYVKFIGWNIRHTDGKTEVLSPDEKITALAPGEALVKQYACYSCVAPDSVLYLQSVVSEIVKEFDLKLEFEENIAGLGNINTVDDYIIEEVKKYTGDELLAQYNKIMDSDDSYESKFYRLNTMFGTNLLGDAQEGVKYMSQVAKQRQNYLYLTTDETYCAANYTAWMNSSLAAKATLKGMGLIYDNQLVDLVNISTIINNLGTGDDVVDIPTLNAQLKISDVKRCKKLLQDYMGVNAEGHQLYSQTAAAAEFYDNICKLNKSILSGATETKLDKLMDGIINCTSKTELQSLQTEFAETIVSSINPNDSLNIMTEQLPKATGCASAILKCVDATAQDINDIFTMSYQMEVYSQYAEFLTEVRDNKMVSGVMRVAAGNLLDDIENGYYNRVVHIFKQCQIAAADVIDSLEMCVGFDTNVFAMLMTEFVSEACGEFISDSMKTLEVATFVSNLIIDTGDFYNQVSNTVAYGELSTVYTQKLKEDKTAFQQNPTAYNAWKFFSDYTYLWELRYKGEEQYMKSNEVKVMLGFEKIELKDYEWKSEVVKQTQKQLKSRMFHIKEEYTIPENVQYHWKAVVSCPVNVNVYLQDGTPVASLQDGVLSDIVNKYGRFAVTYDPSTEEYIKVICQSTDTPLVVKSTAVSSGLVNYQAASTANPDMVYTFNNIRISTGNVLKISSSVSDMATAQYALYDSDDSTTPTLEDFIMKADTDSIPAESVETNTNTLSLAVGTQDVIEGHILPRNATNATVKWLSMDETVASIKNGVITAVGEGTTTVRVSSLESNELYQEVSVTVTPCTEHQYQDGVCVYCGALETDAAYLATTETDLQTALESGRVIQLADDITLSQTIVIDSEQSVVIDLNGHTLSNGESDFSVLTVNGILTLLNDKDTGGISSGTATGVEVNDSLNISGNINGSIWLAKEKKLHIVGAVTCMDNGISIRMEQSDGTFAYGNFEVNGTVKTALDYLHKFKSEEHYIIQADAANQLELHRHVLTYQDAIAATPANAGNIAYWYCTGCNKYFSDADGNSVISQSSTYIGKTIPVSISAVNGSYTINGAALDENGYAQGMKIKVESVPDMGYTFLYWKDADGHILTTDRSYTFLLGSAVSLIAEFKKEQQETYHVTFQDMNGNIVGEDDVEKNGTATPPDSTALGNFTGYVFKDWDQPLTNIQKDTVITAIYDKCSTYTVTIVNGLFITSEKSQYEQGEFVKVKAETHAENEYFAGWYCLNKLVSDQEEYGFYVTSDVELTAVFEEREIEESLIVNLNVSARKNLSSGKQSISMPLTWKLSKDYTLVQAGILRTLVDAQCNDLVLEKVDSSVIKKAASSLNTAQGTYDYTLTLSVASKTKNVYARGYITIANKNTGEISTIYTDVFTSIAA